MGRIPAFHGGAGRVTTFGGAALDLLPCYEMLTLMMSVLNNNAARTEPLRKLAVVVFKLYRFSMWELENRSECVGADKRSGPRCFPEVVYQPLGLESPDLIDW